MSKDVLRLSQVVGTFGPGAMVDLPERSVMISGLDNWEMGGKGVFRVIEERRLVELLEQRLQGDPCIAQGKPLSLRTPPIDPGLFGAGPGPGVPATIFPTWFTCDTVDPGPLGGDGSEQRDGEATREPRRRRIVQWTNPVLCSSRHHAETGAAMQHSPLATTYGELDVGGCVP